MIPRGIIRRVITGIIRRGEQGERPAPGQTGGELNQLFGGVTTGGEDPPGSNRRRATPSSGTDQNGLRNRRRSFSQIGPAQSYPGIIKGSLGRAITGLGGVGTV